MYQNGYQQYKMQSVNTMTRGEMLLLLYDELVKRLTKAELALEKEEFDIFDASVKRAQEIVQYLQETLNTEYSISRDLQRMYDFFLYEISRLQAGRKKTEGLEVVDKIASVNTDYSDKPLQPQRMATVTVETFGVEYPEPEKC